MNRLADLSIYPKLRCVGLVSDLTLWNCNLEVMIDLDCGCLTIIRFDLVS